MTKISIMYPNTKNATFDMNYYLNPYAHVVVNDCAELLLHMVEAEQIPRSR